MVSNRCKMAVKEELKKLGLHFIVVDLGEIDIMENVGNEPTFVYGSLHGPGYYDVDPITSSFSLPDGQEFSADYHTYAIEWDKSSVRFYVDEYNYATVAKRKLPPNSKWVFNKPFYIILNLAVGGDWPGKPDSTTVFPKNMYVDYVRVYKK